MEALGHPAQEAALPAMSLLGPMQAPLGFESSCCCSGTDIHCYGILSLVSFCECRVLSQDVKGRNQTKMQSRTFELYSDERQKLLHEVITETDPVWKIATPRYPARFKC
jgi:hypothetical protein